MGTVGKFFGKTDSTINKGWGISSSSIGKIMGQTLSLNADASGGTITYADGYKIHTFTSSGTLTFTSGGSVEYLAVGGGGSGGAGTKWLSMTPWAGGGGGAGVMLTGCILCQKLQKRLGIGGGHGDSFKMWAEKINKVMGDNYVTQQSDDEYVQQVKDFFVMIISHGDKYGYTYFQRLSAHSREVLPIYVNKYKAKIFKTNNKRFTRGPVFKPNGRFALPSDKDTQDLLKSMYDSYAEVEI